MTQENHDTDAMLFSKLFWRRCALSRNAVIAVGIEYASLSHVPFTQTFHRHSSRRLQAVGTLNLACTTGVPVNLPGPPVNAASQLQSSAGHNQKIDYTSV